MVEWVGYWLSLCHLSRKLAAGSKRREAGTSGRKCQVRSDRHENWPSRRVVMELMKKGDGSPTDVFQVSRELITILGAD
jgi:hypothetical protein